MADATSTLFTFARCDEPWQIGILVAAAAVAAWAAWRWYGPCVPGPLGQLARICRSLGMAVLVLLLGWPALSRTDVTVLPGEMAVAIDTSASMARGDCPGGATRIAAAEALLERLRTEQTARRMRVAAFALDDATTQLNTGPTAEGRTSPLGDALATIALERRPDVLVMASDGRSTAGSTLAATAERLRGRDLRLLILATGGDHLDPELFLDEVAVNREVALDELEPVTVRLSVRALPAGPVHVELLLDGAVIDQADVTVPPEGDVLHALEARLGATFRKEGEAHIVVRATAGGLVRSQELGVTVAERRLGVLLLDRQPRFEMRYLREALKRDSGATLHAYLADQRWRRWGADGPDRLPMSAADLAAYDAIILGDLGPEAFRDADLTALARHVRQDGAGLILIPGETGAAAGWARSPLAELLPVMLPDATAVARGYREQTARRLVRTPLAEALGLLDSGGTPWAELAPLLGAAPADPRPGSEVLATDQDGAPLVVARAAGAGRAIIILADDIWRWRRGVGDRYLHRFHSQLLRYAAAGRRAGSRPWRVTASPRRASPGEPVAIDLVPAPGLEIDLPEQASIRLSGPDGAELVVALTRRGRGFAGRLSAPAPGTWNATTAAGVAADRVEPGELLVVPSEDERRDPRADRPALAALAAATGGQVFDSADALFAALPRDLGHAESATAERGLWDTWWALALVVTLLGADWAIRRRNRLP